MRCFFLSLVGFIFASTVLAQVLNQTCSSTALPDTPIPPDALHSVEVVQLEYQPVGNMTALGYDYITPIINVVMTYLCNRGISSMVEVKGVRLIRYDSVTWAQEVKWVYNYDTGNNCGASQSHWIGPTNGKIVTVRAPTMLYTY